MPGACPAGRRGAAIAGLSYCLQFLRLRSGSYCALHTASLITSFATLRHPLRSAVFSSPAAYNLARRPPTSAAFTLRLLIAHVVPPFRKAPLRFTCIVLPPSYPSGNLLRRHPMVLAPQQPPGYASCVTPKGGCCFTASPFVGLAGTSVRTSLQCLVAARHLRYSPGRFAGRPCFFLPQALLPAGLRTVSHASKKALLN